jgi:hypothetical protein
MRQTKIEVRVMYPENIVPGRFLMISSETMSIPEITAISTAIVEYVRYCEPLPVNFIRVTDMLAITMIDRKALSILLLFLCIISEKIEDFVSFASSILFSGPRFIWPSGIGKFYAEVYYISALYSDKITYALNIGGNMDEFKKCQKTGAGFILKKFSFNILPWGT